MPDITQLVDQVLGSFSNQFLAGGLGLMIVGWLGYIARSVPGRVWDAFLYFFTIVVDVQSTDRAYAWFMFWLEKQEYGRKARRVSIRDVDDGNGETRQVLVPAKGRHWFVYKGRILWLSRVNDEQAAKAGLETQYNAFRAPRESVSIRTVGRSQTVIQALIEEARGLYEATTKNLLKVYAHRWGDWQSSYKEKRPLSSVFLPEQADGLLEEVKLFASQRDWYREMGIPYRRGYLFYGPPGTGKTSAVAAIASELGIPIYALNLASMPSDSNLETAIAHIENKEGIFILLIEDIDTVNIKREHEESTKQKFSLGTLLNSVDGLQAQDGVVLILTSNRPDALDPALLRTGRIDRKVEFSYCTEEQVQQAVRRFLPNGPTPEQQTEIDKLVLPCSMSDVQELLKRLALGGGPRDGDLGPAG